MGSSGARTQAGIATTSGWNGCYFLCKETPDCVYFEWVNEQNSSMLLYLTKLGLHATLKMILSSFRPRGSQQMFSGNNKCY